MIPLLEDRVYARTEIVVPDSWPPGDHDCLEWLKRTIREDVTKWKSSHSTFSVSLLSSLRVSRTNLDG